MRAEGRIARYIDGLPHAALVEVDVDLNSTVTVVNEEYLGGGWVGQGHLEEVSEVGYEDWKAGARNGVLWALRVAGVSGRVTLKRITGMITDTNPDIVACASALAVWNAIGFQPDPPELNYIDEVLRTSWKRQKNGQQSNAPDAFGAR